MPYFCQKDLNTFSEKIDLIRAAYPNWTGIERSELYCQLKKYLEIAQIKDLMYTRGWEEVYSEVHLETTIIQNLVIQLKGYKLEPNKIKIQKESITKSLFTKGAYFKVEYCKSTNQFVYQLPSLRSTFHEHLSYLFDLSSSTNKLFVDVKKINLNVLTSKEEYILDKTRKLLQYQLEPLYMILNA